MDNNKDKLMRMKKIDIINDLESMTEEKDILVDKLDAANNTIEELEEEIEDLKEKEEALDILIDLIDQFYTARMRYAMGILSELETIEKLTDKILDMKSIT